MNKRQKSILLEIITVIVVTAIAIIAMLNVRGYVNRREAKLAMTILGDRIRQYRAASGLAPPENWVDRQRENLPGEVRLGELNYRGRWIDIGSGPNEILAYAEHKSRSFFKEDGYFVLRLSEVLPQDSSAARTVDKSDEGQGPGELLNIEWMETEDFKSTLAEQQSQKEIEFLNK